MPLPYAAKLRKYRRQDPSASLAVILERAKRPKDLKALRSGMTDGLTEWH